MARNEETAISRGKMYPGRVDAPTVANKFDRTATGQSLAFCAAGNPAGIAGNILRSSTTRRDSFGRFQKSRENDLPWLHRPCAAPILRLSAKGSEIITADKCGNAVEGFVVGVPLLILQHAAGMAAIAVRRPG